MYFTLKNIFFNRLNSVDLESNLVSILFPNQHEKVKFHISLLLIILK